MGQIHFNSCAQLAEEFRSTAIKHVCSDIYQAILCLKLKAIVDARNRVEIPHGLFGMSWDNFFLRRHKDTLYMDVLPLVEVSTLQKAKCCVIIEELQDFVQRIYKGYLANDLTAVHKDLWSAHRLLSIYKSIRGEYKKNNEELQHLRSKLSSFSKYEREMSDHLNNMIYEAMNECVDAELVKAPIEFRYELRYQTCGISQLQLRWFNVEQDYTEKLRLLRIKAERENLANTYARAKFQADIAVIKKQLDYYTKRFDEDNDRLSGDINYIRNNLDGIRNQRTDCDNLLVKYTKDIVDLKKWQEDKLDKARAKIQESTLKEEKKKQKKVGKVKKSDKKDVSTAKPGKKKP